MRPGDHTVVRTLADNAKLRAKLAALKRPEVEFLRVPIGGGVTLDGWSMKPANVDPAAKLPLLMYVYGEPHGQTVRDAWPGPRGLWHWMLAQQGFVVASVDNRGTNVPRGREWRKCRPPEDRHPRPDRAGRGGPRAARSGGRSSTRRGSARGGGAAAAA